MTQRIKDKFLIVILTIAAIVLLSGSVTAIHVSVILASVIFAAIDEIFTKRWIPFLFVVLSIVAVFYSSVAIMVIPMLIYILFAKSKTYEYIAAGVLLALGLFKSEELLPGVLLTILSVVAGYISYYSAYYERTISRSTVLFDEARREANESSRKRQELRQKQDAQIYTERLKERNRIAREIHDNVGHMLTRAVVQMQAIMIINKDEKLKPHLESVNSTINEAMTNIRRSVHELHDDSIDISIGINELSSVLKDKFDVDVKTSIESPVPNETKMQILGIVKEAVTNISKHSNGDKVLIEFVENITFWRLMIYDNGKSSEFELAGNSAFAAIPGSNGIGLSNINSRASSVGGRAFVKSGKDGFKVMVTIPKK